MSIYSPYKVFSHLDKLEILRNGGQPPPVHVQLIISDLCNQDCAFCAYRLSGYPTSQLFVEHKDGQVVRNPKRMIPFEKCIEILEDCQHMGVKAIQFSVFGDEVVPIVTNGVCESVRLGEFVDKLFGDKPCDKPESIGVNGIQTYAIDDAGKVILSNIAHAYRHESIEDLYEVTLDGGRSVVVTGSHSLNIVEDNKIIKKPVAELNAGELVACAKWIPPLPDARRTFNLPEVLMTGHETLVPDQIPESAELYRLLGYYTAEGSICSRSLLWTFGTNAREQQYISDVVNCLSDVFGVVAIVKNRKTSTQVWCNSVRIQKLFVDSFKSGEIQQRRGVPNIVWQAPASMKLEYLKGLFAGDGNFRSNIYKKKYRRNTLHLKTSSKRIADEVTMLLQQLGIGATITKGINNKRKIEGRQLPDTTYYTVNISNRDGLKILEEVVRWTGGDLQYKNNLCSIVAQKCTKSYCTLSRETQCIPIKSILKRPDLGRPVVYDLTVEDTHRFITTSGIGCANTGGGESTTHPQHAEIFNKTAELGLEYSLVTNGMVLRPQTIEALKQASWIRISLDAGNKHTYAAVRRTSLAAFDKVLSNISKLVANKPKNQVIGVGFVVTKDNYKELLQAVKITKEIGVDNLRISAVFQPDNERYFQGWYEEASELCKTTEQTSNETFTVYNLFGDRVNDLIQKQPAYSFCGYQHFTTYIGGDLNVYRCCVTAYNERGLIGSLKDQRFRKLWESQEKFDKFANFDAKQCERCQFNNKNAAILGAISNQPHSSFV